MKKLRLKVIGKGTMEDPYRVELTLGVTHKEGDIIMANIPTDEKGKPTITEANVVILEKGIDFS